jgi:hypothetical protein
MKPLNRIDCYYCEAKAASISQMYGLQKSYHMPLNLIKHISVLASKVWHKHPIVVQQVFSKDFALMIRI